MAVHNPLSRVSRLTDILAIVWISATLQRKSHSWLMCLSVPRMHSHWRFCFKFTPLPPPPPPNFWGDTHSQMSSTTSKLILRCYNVKSFAANLFYKLQMYLRFNSNRINDMLVWPSPVTTLEISTTAKLSINYILIVILTGDISNTEIKIHTSGVALCRRKLG